MPNLGQLTLTDFRNYASLSVALERRMIVLTGDNGAGKTNLLEAISLLAPGRGLRRSAYAEIAREAGSGTFAVNAQLVGPFGEASIGTGVTGAEAGAGEAMRKVRINGAAARNADDLLDWLRVMWLTPSMDGLFTGPAADRRRFLDRLVLTVNTAHGRISLAYEKAMRDRNRLLTDGSRDWRWFAAVETQMAESATAIAAARVETVRLLASMMERLPDDGAFPKADLALAGSLETWLAERPAVEVEGSFRDLLAENRERDRAAGRALDGPHRSDLLVRHRPKDMPAELCSTGEQKALLIGIILSHARLVADMSGLTPVLLLDEVAAHLDATRRAALFAILEDLGGQVFMTGTDASLFSAIEDRAQFLTVDHGDVRPTR